MARQPGVRALLVGALQAALEPFPKLRIRVSVGLVVAELLKRRERSRKGWV